MDIFHLEYFCTVALTKNISEAARRHYISQPAMSKYMSHIEKELQTPLFIRNGNQIMLSAEGEKFFVHAQRVIGEYKDALGALKEGKTRLTINVQVNTTRHILVHYLKEFLATHPLVDILIDFNYKQEVLNSTENNNMYHFSIGGKNVLHYHNKHTSLFSERHMLAVPPGHRLACRDHVSVKELVNEFFVFQAMDKNYSKNLVDCCEKNGFTPKARVLCNETKYLCNLVAAGIGLSVVPEYSWKDMLSKDVSLVAIDEMANAIISHKLFWNDNRFYPEDMIDFREGLIRHYNSVTTPQSEL